MGVINDYSDFRSKSVAFAYPNISLAGSDNEYYIRILYCQALLESGKGFNSNIAVENLNIFGMKKPKIRETLAIGENRGHATYASVSDSIMDRIMLDVYNKITPPASASDYSRYLWDVMHKGYVPDTPGKRQNYVTSVLTIYNREFNANLQTTKPKSGLLSLSSFNWVLVLAAFILFLRRK